MPEALLAPLAPWQSFYVLIGTVAATLTGLMFVVITLSASTSRPGRNQVLGAFATPTLVHFGAALLIAVQFNAPWPVLWPPSVLLGLCGVGGVTYGIVVLRRARQQTEYQAVLEDWLWHFIFPPVAYVAFIAAAVVLPGNPTPALFISGAATVLLLFIGIHNAWDAVVYITLMDSQSEQQSQDEQKER
jgi:hypothetical protein